MKYLGKIQDPKDLVTKEYVDNGHVLNSKTYTGVIGTANDWANATFFFGVVKPTDYNTHWKIRYRVYAQAAGDYRAQATSDFTLNGINSTYTTYKAYNSIINGSYRPVYYHVYYRATSAGMTYGHAMGIRLYSSWNPTTAANARTIKIEILEVENCTFTFFDSMTKYASIPGTGSTNYAGYTEFNFADNGLQESGDANTTTQLNNAYQVVKTGTNGIFPYTFIMQKLDGTWESNVTSSSTGNKSVNTSGFLPDSIHWYYNGTTRAAGANVPTSCISELCDLRDMRYPLNGITTTASTSAIHANSPLYLVGTITNGLFYFDTSSWFSESLPSTDNGKVYILVGVTYDAYRTQLYANNPMYWYKNGAVRLYGDYGVSGIVSSVAATGSGGITISGSPITSSGTLTIGVNGSTVINNLSEGSSPAQRNDYIVAQYAGGGTTTTSYHRRKLSNIFAALNSSDITTALGYTPPATDHTYNFSGTTFYSGNSGTAEHNANLAVKNGNYYYTSNGPATSLGASTTDGALYVQSYSDSWVGQIAQDYRNGGLFVRGKNNGTWQSWQQVYDTGHTIKLNSNNLPQFSGAPQYLLGIDAFADGGTMKWQGVGSVSVGYATSAGNASTVNNHSVAVDVPSGAKFTDTTYTAGSGLRLSGTQFINTRIPFVMGTQTAVTGSWTGVCNDITALYDGLTIAYWLPYAGSGNATLNLTINGTATGAKNCYYGGTTRLTTHYGAGNIIYLTYQSAANINGTSYEGWWAQSQYDSNTVSQVRQDYSTVYAGPAGIFPYTLIMMNTSGSYESIVTSSSTGTSKAKNTAGFVPGTLKLMYANATTTNGNKISGSNYSLFDAYCAFDFRYSANITTTSLTVGRPVYLKGSITNGLFYLADDPWWTQTLPTTEDGFVYMYVGNTYNYYGASTEYRVNIAPYHPIYHYVNGTLREYGGDAATINGHTVATDVPSGAKFTDTVTTATTTGSGNAVTKITASNGALTVTKGITFAEGSHSHGGITTSGKFNIDSYPEVSIASGDMLLIVKGSNTNIRPTSITFDGETTNRVLSRKGTWVTLPSVPSSGTDAELTTGTSTSTRVWTPKILHDYIASHGGSSATTLTVTLSASGWSSGTQTVTATGVTASNNVIVSPAPASYMSYGASGIYCSAQASNSLTFTCTTTPTTALTVNVMILD